MGTEPGSRSSLDSSFRNRLPFVLEICLCRAYLLIFGLVAFEKLPESSGGSLTSIDVHSGLLCSTVGSFVWLHNACRGRRMVLTRELHDGRR